ncbi:MAG: molybdenum ABC transporter ATP-binding protein [Defluviicoccus sp.]
MIEVEARLRQGHFSLDAAFSCDQGITALFGRSGSGKSTVIGIIAGIRRPDQGRVALNGRTLVDTDANVWLPPHRRRVGLVFQDSQLFPHLTVRQNLLYGRWFSRHGAAEIPFDSVVATLGIETLLPRRPPRLSGGEKQRVALGRALLANPALLLMDEPLTSLDMARKIEILPLIESIRDDFRIPVLYVSHAVEEVARLADTVVALDAGRVVACGPPATVLGTPTQPPEGDRFAVASVLDVSVGPFDERYGLTMLRHPAGEIFLTGRIGAVRHQVRIVIKAIDVALATEPPAHLSIRTVLRARVAAIAADGSAVAAVHLSLTDGGRLVALATRKAIDELDLAPGKPVFALIKTVAVDERPMGAIDAASGVAGGLR